MTISALIMAAFIAAGELVPTPTSPLESASARLDETQDQFRRRAAQWVLQSSEYGPWSAEITVNSIVFFRWDKAQQPQDVRAFDLTFRLSDRRCVSVALLYRPAKDLFEKGRSLSWDCHEFFPKMGHSDEHMPLGREGIARAA
ncbi:hypothetical protein [Sphingopyxis sp. YF1]|uniref:hypothetical protein n=1 Tax=Sphingopyxis sp. YF1 TaxID=2482763 RepID=UPI001F616990|nr:hypothetical protein [Sphingopyxis sp. YF1]